MYRTMIFKDAFSLALSIIDNLYWISCLYSLAENLLYSRKFFIFSFRFWKQVLMTVAIILIAQEFWKLLQQLVKMRSLHAGFTGLLKACGDVYQTLEIK